MLGDIYITATNNVYIDMSGDSSTHTLAVYSVGAKRSAFLTGLPEFYGGRGLHKIGNIVDIIGTIINE